MDKHHRLAEWDRRHVWHPYASIADPPLATMIESADGVRLYTADGQELIDGMSSWWAAIHGYNHPVLNEAARGQLEGIMVPLNEKAMMIDLIKHLGLPVLLVAKSGLGTINHTLLSLEQLKRRGLVVAGIVMNGEPCPENREALAHYGKTPIIAEVKPLARVDAEILTACFQQYFA